MQCLCNSKVVIQLSKYGNSDNLSIFGRFSEMGKTLLIPETLFLTTKISVITKDDCTRPLMRG